MVSTLLLKANEKGEQTILSTGIGFVLCLLGAIFLLLGFTVSFACEFISNVFSTPFSDV